LSKNDQPNALSPLRNKGAVASKKLMDSKSSKLHKETLLSDKNLTI
jgi:hypothetical protein